MCISCKARYCLEFICSLCMCVMNIEDKNISNSKSCSMLHCVVLAILCSLSSGLYPGHQRGSEQVWGHMAMFDNDRGDGSYIMTSVVIH